MRPKNSLSLVLDRARRDLARLHGLSLVVKLPPTGPRLAFDETDLGLPTMGRSGDTTHFDWTAWERPRRDGSVFLIDPSDYPDLDAALRDPL